MSVLKNTAGEVLYKDAARNPAEIVRAAAERGDSLACADLSGLDLSGMTLDQIDLSNARLAGARLQNAYLRDCDLSGADLADVDARGLRAVGSMFDRARLGRANLAEGVFARCSFSRIAAGGFDEAGASLGLQADRACFTECSFTQAQVGGSSFREAEFDACDAHGWSAGRADFSRATINMMDMNSTHMRGARLRGAAVANSQLDNSDLREADLRDVRMISGSLTDSVLIHADLRDGRYRQVEMTGARAGRAKVAGNVYDRCENMPAEMHADRHADRVAKAMAKGLSYASLAGAFAGGFMLAPDSVTEGLTNNQMVGRGLAGMATMAGANLAMRKLGPVVHKQVIERIERVLARSAPGVSRAAARIPFADMAHWMRDMEFARVTGINERRVARLVDRANRADPDPSHPLEASGVIADDGKGVILVARDRQSMARVQEALANGRHQVVVLRLDEEGRPRERGPALYAFERDGTMTAVWYHEGRPDFGARFDREGRPTHHRGFSARDAMLRADHGTVHTRILSRRETTREEALAWLNASPETEAARNATGHGQSLAVRMREGGHLLRAAGEYLGASHPDLAAEATEVAVRMEATNPGRSDRVAPEAWPKAARAAAKALERSAGALAEIELTGLARIAERVTSDIRAHASAFESARAESARAGGAGERGDTARKPRGDAQPKGADKAAPQGRRRRRSRARTAGAAR